MKKRLNRMCRKCAHLSVHDSRPVCTLNDDVFSPGCRYYEHADENALTGMGYCSECGKVYDAENFFTRKARGRITLDSYCKWCRYDVNAINRKK